MATTLSFTLVSRTIPIIIVPGTINGNPGRFIVDTGASACVVGKDFAARHSLGGKKTKEKAHGIGGTQKVERIRIKELAVGTKKEKNVHAAVMDISMITRQVGKHIDGIIGYTFMKKSKVTIDYPKKKISFL